MLRTSLKPERIVWAGLASIPADWDIAPLGNICKTQYGLSLSASNDGAVPIVGMQHLVNGRVEIRGAKRVIVSAQTLEKYTLEVSDVLFNRTNSFDQVGKTAIFMGHAEPVVFASYLIRLLMKRGFSPQFLNIYMNMPSVIQRIKSLATPGVSQFNISPSVLSKHLLVPTPRLTEQTAIASRIGAWDQRIWTVENLIKLKRRLKRGLMQQLLTGRRRFSEFAGQPWREVRIGDLLREQYRGVVWDDNAAYNLVSIRRRSGGFFVRERRHGHQIKTKVMQAVKAGDFVIARMQVVHGAMAMVRTEFDGMHVSDSYTILVPRDDADLHMPFLDYLSQTPAMYYKALRSSYGVAIEKMTFSLDWFLRESVSVPPTLAEQQKIAAVLSAADREIALLEKELAALREQKKGLMQKLLTGQVRLPEFRTEGVTA